MAGDDDEQSDHLSSAFYEGIGRVVVAAASLDFMLALLASGLAPDPDQDWMASMSTPGGALRRLRRIGSQLPTGPQGRAVLDLIADAGQALKDRHRVTHSLHLIVWGDDMGRTHTGSLHPRRRAWEALPTDSDLVELAGRLRRLGRRAGELIPNTLTVRQQPDGRLTLVED